MATTKQTSDLKQELDSVKNDLSNLQGDVKSLLEAFKQSGADKFESATDSAKATAQEQLDNLKKAAEKARAQGESSLGDLQGEIKNHPLSSVTAAFAVGYLISKVLDR